MAAERMRVRLRITQEDIDKAHRKDSFSCVVAQAVARTIPEAHHIEVDTQTIRWTENGVRYLWLTPYVAQEYVISFDAGHQIRPFTCTLSRRTPVQQQERTKAGTEIDRARSAVRTAEEGLERTEAAAEREDATLKQVGAAKARVTKARHTLEAVQAAHRGEKQIVRLPGPGRSKAPPRVFKKRERHYGRRVLRINWPENEGHTPDEARKLAQERLARTPE
jgi:hypothetical protein